LLKYTIVRPFNVLSPRPHSAPRFSSLSLSRAESAALSNSHGRFPRGLSFPPDDRSIDKVTSRAATRFIHLPQFGRSAA
jgi:hypothetical protein